MKGSNLATEKIPAYAGNYTKGRSGYSITEITIHHMAARWTARRCGESFQAVGRQGSSHYGIGYDGEIAQYVSEEDTAWTNGLWESNCRAVTIECANESSGGEWRVSDATVSSLIKLVADIAKRNGLYPLVKCDNFTWHQMYSPTACPGPYLISQLDRIVNEANKIIGGNGEAAQTNVSCAYQVFTDQWLPNVTGSNENDHDNGYAGILGAPISGFVASAYGTDLTYKVHNINGEWLPEVKNRDDFAGILGRPIDGVMIRSEKTLIHYKVHTTEDGWLPAVTGYSESDHDNGYAGILGHTVDGIILWSEPITTVIEKAPAPDPAPTVTPPPEAEMEEAPEDTPAERTETPPEETLPEIGKDTAEEESVQTEQKEAKETGKIRSLIIKLLEIIIAFLKGEAK